MKKTFLPTTIFSEFILSIFNTNAHKRRNKYFSIVIGLLLLSFSSTAQVDTNSMWTWMSGDNIANQLGVYGEQGETLQGTMPGSRVRSVSWRDAHGNLWLMGGYGYATSGVQGFLNDLWKYNPENNLWTWVAGDNTINQYGIYGIQGIASPNNKPGARNGAASWTDPEGNFWLMGGNGYYSNGFGFLNDLWKYNTTTNEWTWVKGDNASYVPGVYGTQGVPAASNNPGGREHPVTWTDNKGKLWLMGGAGYDTQGWGYLNDLWKFDPDTNEWTWVKGESTSYSFGVYGTQGIAAAGNKPGARQFALGWTDQNGKFWMMGGVGNAISGFGSLNDLWKYDPETNEWTWMKGDNTIDELGVYGTMGVTAVTNKPGARYGSCNWIDPAGKLWLLGGYVGYSLKGIGYFNDLWKYDPDTNEWTWVNGVNTADPPGVYGTRGIAAQDNNPRGRQLGLSWIDLNGKLWLMGGYSYISNGQSKLNDLWKYDPATNEWTWMKGDNIIDQPAVYGPQGIGSNGNFPGARNSFLNWTAPDGTLWIMGGQGQIVGGSSGLLNDLWKYIPASNEWTWVKGDNISNQFGIYGTKGISSYNNKPGSRQLAVSWTTPDGKLWLMGGQGLTAYEYGMLNDLWKYDPLTNEWTWVSGDDSIYQKGIYGTKGIASAENIPGARFGGVTWTDKQGKLWMMGGISYENSPGLSKEVLFNDLWKYDPLTNLWTWVSGDNIPNQKGVYGKQGVPSSLNKPSPRWKAVSWLGNDGSLWLMGGMSYADLNGFFNDLWKYNPVTNEWTWMKGDSSVNMEGNYGTKGIPSTNSFPGGRYGAVGWTDRDGKLWLHGGLGYVTKTVGGPLNDLWKYDPLSNEWTWVKGDNITNQPGIYGTRGTAALINKPGARWDAVSFYLPDGNLWLMGGIGFSESGGGGLNDLWKLTPTENTYYKDADSDSYGNPDISMQANYVPAGYVLKAGDCNDNNAAVHPGAEEICDGLDNNCDGIVDEGCPPVSKTKVFVKDIIVLEGNEGYRNAIFPVWLNGKSTVSVTIKYQTVDSSATSLDDYKSTSGTICFSPNSLFQVITVKVRGDRTMEPNEKFRLVLYAPVNAVLTDSSATCTIINDDKRPSIHIHDATATEKSGMAMVKVTMKEESAQVIKVKYFTKEKSAKSPEDYIGIKNGELIFLPGEKEKYIKVTIVRDNIKEKTEEFELRLKDDEHGRWDDEHGKWDKDKDCRYVAEVKIINSSSIDNSHPGASGKYFNTSELPSELQVRVLPNPSQNYFQVNLASNGKGAMQLRVSDMQGRVVEYRKIEGMMQQIKLGDRWSYGNYILQVIQGDEMKTVQLIKLK